jgi:uncharacterized protein YukE
MAHEHFSIRPGPVNTLGNDFTASGDHLDGRAADAFHAHWSHTRNQVEEALPHFATVAQQLDTAADAIAKANAEVHHVVEEIAATALIGIGLSVLTAGFSDVVAAGAAEAEVAEAAGLPQSCRTAAPAGSDAARPIPASPPSSTRPRPSGSPARP